MDQDKPHMPLELELLLKIALELMIDSGLSEVMLPLLFAQPSLWELMVSAPDGLPLT